MSAQRSSQRIEVGLRLVDGFETEPLQRCLLGVTDTRFDLALPIRISDTAGQRDDAVVGQHVTVEWIELGVVYVRLDDAFAQVVEDDDARRSSQPAKGTLVQLGPDLGARARYHQPYRLPGVPERHDEEPSPSVLARASVSHHRPVAGVVDLCFLARRGRDDDAGLDRLAAAQLQHKALHARVAGLEAVVVHQVLPDRHRVPAAAQRLQDQLAEWLTGARTRRAARRRRPFPQQKAGGHPLRNGRF